MSVCRLSFKLFFCSDTDIESGILHNHRRLVVFLHVIVVTLVGRRRGPLCGTVTLSVPDRSYHLAHRTLDARRPIRIHERNTTPTANNVTQLIRLGGIIQRVAEGALDMPGPPGIRQLASTRRVTTRKLGHIRAIGTRDWGNKGAARATDMLCTLWIHQQAATALAHDLCLQRLLALLKA